MNAPTAPAVPLSTALARAHGAPCPTAVLDARELPESQTGQLGSLTALRGELAARGTDGVLKNALVRPSRHPLFDLDYRFVQSLPGSDDAFDVRGSCGHSILAAVEAAARTGMIQPLVPGCRVRVNVLNNGDNVVCEVEETSTGGTRFTAHFLCSPPRPLGDLLLAGEPRTRIPFGGGSLEVSLVSMGNPYVLVSAADLGAGSVDALFADDPALFARMLQVRRTVCEAQGWDPHGAFPKIAALLPDGPQRLAVRAVSVPSWHPTVALTGAVCLGSAAEITDSVPWRLLAEAGRDEGLLTLRTTDGEVRVAASTSGAPADRHLAWVSVARKQVDYAGLLRERTPGSPASPHTSASEETPWLPLTV